MLGRHSTNTSRKHICKWLKTKLLCKHFSQKHSLKQDHESELSLIRNIGILAHIDAGKTTTTERMLYYSGTINMMGEVHHGNTVTDYMEEERNRGITITSAAVTFNWHNYKFNLIDTPGHIDFTIEVERTLNVLDGAVVILDGSAGVEAQTLTVWRQADKYEVPRIVYVNKMDRSDASLSMSAKSLRTKLNVVPLVVQLPVRNDSGKYNGIVDLINLTKLIWNSTDQGKSYTEIPLSSKEHGSLWDESVVARHSLIEDLSDIDDKLAETVIQHDSLDVVSAEDLIAALRRATLSHKGAPVLCGSSYKNVGVQPLMDAVIKYLPPPSIKSKEFANAFGTSLCARAFKIIHDDQRKPITFFRIYNGNLTKGQKIYNVNQGSTEQIGQLMVIYADETKEVSEVTCGNIAAICNLKAVSTGDFITSNASAAAKAKKKFAENNEVKKFGLETTVPDPVFFCSIEPESQAYQKVFDRALQELQREDPSLKVTTNDETGQTILGGMGELHLDIVKSRLISHYKLNVDVGPLIIAYRETLANKAKETHVVNHHIGNTHHSVTVTLSVIPGNHKTGNILILDRSPDSASNIDAIHPRYMQPLKQGVESAFSRGPKLSCPVINVHAVLHWLETGKGTSETVVAAAVGQCVKKILTSNTTYLLEPIMTLEIVTCNNYLSLVLADLSRRRSSVQELNDRGNNRVVLATAPLSELLGYSTELRTITSGTASFSMEFNSYQPMNSNDEANAIKSILGFYL